MHFLAQLTMLHVDSHSHHNQAIKYRVNEQCFYFWKELPLEIA